MRIGVDFGTSYCSAAWVAGDRVQHISFGSEKQFRTAAYFPAKVPTVDQFELDDVALAKIATIVTSAQRRQRMAEAEYMRRLEDYRKTKQKGIAPLRPVTLTEAELRADALRAIRREWLQQKSGERETFKSIENALFGDQAIDGYIENPRGQLVQSPKSLLGFNLYPGVSEVLVSIVTHILTYIRVTASQQIGSEVTGVVLGRPVEFKSSMGEEGSRQACSLLENAAVAAGFTEVDFMLEPSAAALDFHKATGSQQKSLVIDVGGGTTDICHARVGGSGEFEPLRTWGAPVGGGEVDLWFSLLNFMPHFGRPVGGVSETFYSEAAMVSDVVRQEKFRRYDFSSKREPFRTRLRALQESGNTVRLARGVERLKIHLSSHQEGKLAIGYIEKGLVVEATTQDLDRAANYFASRFSTLLEEVIGDLAEVPETAVLTGGASAAPYIEGLVTRLLPGIKVLRTDPSLAVVSGLAWEASRLQNAAQKFTTGDLVTS